VLTSSALATHEMCGVCVCAAQSVFWAGACQGGWQAVALAPARVVAGSRAPQQMRLGIDWCVGSGRQRGAGKGSGQVHSLSKINRREGRGGEREREKGERYGLGGGARWATPASTRPTSNVIAAPSAHARWRGLCQNESLAKMGGTTGLPNAAAGWPDPAPATAGRWDWPLPAGRAARRAAAQRTLEQP
jgi:hypothetical protein